MKQAIAGFQVPMNIVGSVEMGKTRSDILEK
jgi:hypothetical protein